MRSTKYRAVAAAGMSVAAVMALSACSSDSSSTETTSATSEATSSPQASGAPSSAPAADPAAGLVGSGCAAYAQEVPSGPGSVAGMAQDPVTVAASNNPQLKTLTQALSGKLNPQVNLIETLNNGEFTVFAPTDAAFGKLPPATVEQLKTDAPLLTSILTYHVVPGQASPDKVEGTHKTVEGKDVTVTGTGDAMKINDASLVCGGVKTANAQVYMIDTVLMPPA